MLYSLRGTFGGPTFKENPLILSPDLQVRHARSSEGREVPKSHRAEAALPAPAAHQGVPSAAPSAHTPGDVRPSHGPWDPGGGSGSCVTYDLALAAGEADGG